MADDFMEGLQPLPAPPPRPKEAAPADATPVEASGDDFMAGLKPLGKPGEEPSAAQSAASGAVSGVAQILGAPVDVSKTMFPWYDPGLWHGLASVGEQLGFKGPGTEAIREIGNRIQGLPGGSEWINQKLGAAGLPTTENVKPQDPLNRGIQQGVRGAVGFVAPGLAGKAAALSGLPRVGEALMALTPGMAEANTARGVLGATAANAGYGASSGISGEVASAITPEARPIGEVLGAGIPAVGVAAATAAGRRAFSDLVPPVTQAGQQNLANRAAVADFERSASNLDPSMALLKHRLDADEAELVPGSRSTTPEISEDPGLLALQHARANFPNSTLGNSIREQRAANNDARARYLDQMAAESASGQAQTFLRDHLAYVDRIHEGAIADAKAQAEATGNAAKPTLTPEEQGALAKGAVEAERAPVTAGLMAEEQQARQGLESATGAFGGIANTAEERAAAPAQYGARMRDPVEEANAAERARLSQLRATIDPTGTMGMRTDAIKAALQDIANNFHPDMFGGMENKLYNRADEWGGLVPIEEAFRLRADTNARLKNVPDHNPQEALRLTTLRRGIDDAIAQTTADIEALERSGLVPNQPSLGERLAALEGETNVAPSTGENVAAEARSVGQAVPAAENAGNVALRPGEVSPGAGGPSQEAGRPVGAPGDQGVPGPAVTEGNSRLSYDLNTPVESAASTEELRNWAERTFGKEKADEIFASPEATSVLTAMTPEAREKFAQFNREYGEMKRAYEGETAGKLHAVGNMLQKRGANEQYVVENENVPWLFTEGGKNGRLALEKFLAVASEDGIAAVEDAFSFSLRREAMRENGTLDLKAYDRWLKPREASLTLRPELLEKFNTAAKAQERLNEVQANLAAHEKAYPLNPGWGDAGILRQFWKPGPEGGEKIRRYLEITGNRPEAVRAIEDYAALDFASRDGVIKDGVVNPKAGLAWLSQHREALKAIPGLIDRFANAIEAQARVAEAVAKHAAARDEFTKSAAGAFLQADPKRAAASLFVGNDRAARARSLVDFISGYIPHDEQAAAALEGVQRSVIDHMLELSGASHGTAYPGSEYGGIKPQVTRDFIGKNSDVIDILFPGRLKNFEALAEDLRRSQLENSARATRGSDTSEIRGRMNQNKKSEGTTLGDVAAIVGAEHVATAIVDSFFSSVTGLFAASMALRWMKGARGSVDNMANIVLDRMIMDPQYALDMRRLYGASTVQARTNIMNRMRQRIAQSMIQSAQSYDLQKPKKAPAYAKGGRIRRAEGGDTVPAADTSVPAGEVVWMGKPAPLSPDEAAKHLWGMTGIPQIQEGLEARQRPGAYPETGAGDIAMGAAQAASLALPVAKGVAPVVEEAARAAPALLEDTSGALRIPRGGKGKMFPPVPETESMPSVTEGGSKLSFDLGAPAETPVPAKVAPEITPTPTVPGIAPEAGPAATEEAAPSIGHNKPPEPMFSPVVGDTGLPNHMPIPEEAVQRNVRKAKREDETVGAVKNEEPIMLPNGVYVGPVNVDQWQHRVETILTPEEIEKAANWYKEALPTYVSYFGPEKGPQMLGAWLMANQNATPGFAQLSAVRALEQFVSKSQGSPKAGLPFDKLEKYWDSIVSGDPSKMGDISTGQKIYDFVDSAVGKRTRTFYGDDPSAGAPAVSDVHSFRDTGTVDPGMYNWIKKTFGDDVAGKFKVDPKRGGAQEAAYEWSADKMRQWTDELNQRGWMGRNDWLPSEIQAIGWMTMSKMMGRAGMTAEDAIKSNIRNLSYELDFGDGAPWNTTFPEWHTLPEEDKARISKVMLDKIADYALEQTGASEYARIAASGGWSENRNSGINPAFRSQLIASPEAAADVADIIGYLAQQTKVYVSRWSNAGKEWGIAVHGNGLDNDAAVRTLWSEIVQKHPDLASGFSPTRDAQGTPGIEMTFGGGGAKLKKRIETELMPTIDAVAKRLGIDTDTELFKAETDPRINNWNDYPDGREHLQRLSARYGPEIQRRLYDYRRSELEPALRQEIERATGKSSAGSGEVGAGAGGRRRTQGLEEAQRVAAQAAGEYAPLEGLPNKPMVIGGDYYVPGPVKVAQDAARQYMESAGLPYNPPRQFAKINKERAARIAEAFDQMKHDPNDPAVKASYDALARETLAQWQAIKNTGLKVEWIKPGQADPYAETPRLAAKDVVENNHWWGFPTEMGFGSDEAAMVNNPMLQMTDEIIDGRRARVNDIFRIVHDYFGHVKDGFGFRAEGEENAWRAHSAMYSDLARPAMTSETRGQNSWVNYGPYGEKNRKASAADTTYAPQKIGILPGWIHNEGRFARGGHISWRIGRADGGQVDSWRTMKTSEQAAHLAEHALRIRDQMSRELTS